MEYIVVVTELGDYALRSICWKPIAIDLVTTSPTASRRRASGLGGAADAALGLVAELDPTLPGDYDLGYTKTVALHYAHRPSDALASLAEVTRLRPDSKETLDLTRFIRTPLRSNATAGFGYFTGSDDVTIRHAGLLGEYVINPETRLFGGTDLQQVSTKDGSGYEMTDGGNAIDYNRAWIGIRHRTSPKLSLDAQIGGGNAEGDSNFVYEVGADLQPADELAMRLSHRQDRYAVSPLATELGIERRANALYATWTPDLRYTVASYLGYDTFSDGNDRWEAELSRAAPSCATSC